MSRSLHNQWLGAICCTSMRLWSPDKLKQPPSIYGDKCNWQLAGTKIGSSETQLGTASGQLEARGEGRDVMVSHYPTTAATRPERRAVSPS